MLFVYFLVYLSFLSCCSCLRFFPLLPASLSTSLAHDDDVWRLVRIRTTCRCFRRLRLRLGFLLRSALACDGLRASLDAAVTQVDMCKSCGTPPPTIPLHGDVLFNQLFEAIHDSMDSLQPWRYLSLHFTGRRWFRLMRGFLTFFQHHACGRCSQTLSVAHHRRSSLMLIPTLLFSHPASNLAKRPAHFLRVRALTRRMDG